MGIATKLLFIVPHSLQMSFPCIALLSPEVLHIIFKCQLSVPQQTGSSLIIVRNFCVSANTKDTVWIVAKNFLMMQNRFSSFPKCDKSRRAAAF